VRSLTLLEGSRAVRSTTTGIQLALAESDESRQDIREAIVASLEHFQSDAQTDNANPSRTLVVPYIRAEIRSEALHIHLKYIEGLRHLRICLATHNQPH
jgi:hypothetical protein